jgi:DNA-directed RNA polymerase specialized sigma24 family protein
VVERADAIERLPVAYAVAMRLLDDGASLSEIAALLGMAVEAVPVLVVIGEQKLAALLVAEPDGGAVVVQGQPDDR